MPKALEALKHAAKAVVATIGETPTGMPGGVLHSVFTAHGISLESIDSLMAVFVEAVKLKHKGHLLFA